MPVFKKSIGIVGGAGPMASAFLYTKILEICQKRYQANDYNDFPEIIIVSYPFTRGNKEKIQAEIALCFSKLKAAGADLISIACNSFHGYLPALSGINFVHLIEEGLKEASRLHVSKALVFGSKVTIDMKLYEKGSLNCLYPNAEDQERISQMIREVAEGKVYKEQVTHLKQMIDHYRKKMSFDAVLLACTELPLIHKQFDLSKDLPIIDTVEVLTRRLVEMALY